MRIETNTNDRKAMAKVLAEFLGVPLHYVGPPTFDYLIGEFAIRRDGSIVSESEENESKLKEFLEENGYIEPTSDVLNVSVSVEGMDGEKLKNLIFMIYSKQYLLNHAVGANCFRVSSDMIENLSSRVFESIEEIQKAVLAYSSKCGGISFDAEEKTITLSFARTDDSYMSSAYVKLSEAMIACAKTATRVSPTVQKPENEKYYFRAWLIRLGFGGNAHKTDRKVLLGNLRGYSAFRTSEAAARFKADMISKRAQKKAKKGSSNV